MNINSYKVGEWERKHLLGKGSFGEVYLWYNIFTRRVVAVKTCCFDTNLFQNHEAEVYKERWLRECEILKKHSNEYLVRWIDVPELTNLGNPNIIVMEYCEGGDLRAKLNKLNYCNGFLEYEVRKILKCLGAACEFLHSHNISHRDIKPENVVITHRNGKKFYKLTDFGYAKSIACTVQGSMVGTQAYLAPEIVQSGNYSIRVDYWSLGVLIFEVICGERPFCLDEFKESIVEISKKKSDEISITKDLNSEIVRHKYLHYENYLSKDFKVLMEKWLRLALEYDPKLRGSEYLTQKLDLTFYSRIKDALESQILTVFSLWNYEFYDFAITEVTTITKLIELLELRTGLDKTDIDIILPIEQTNTLRSDKVMDLYAPELDPMLFITTPKIGHRVNIKDPHLSNEIVQLLNQNDSLTPNIKLPFLKRFAKKVLFMVKKEHKNYVTYINGLRAYALEVNDRLFKLKPYDINMKGAELSNNYKLFDYCITHSRGLVLNPIYGGMYGEFVEKWDKELFRVRQNLDFMIDDISCFQKKFDLWFRKSMDIVNSEVFQLPRQDYYNIEMIEKCLEEVLKKEPRNTDPIYIPECKEVFANFVYSCMHQRKDLLSNHIENMHNNISYCNNNYYELYNTLSDLNTSIDHQIWEVPNLLATHQRELFEMGNRNRESASITNMVNELSLTSCCFETSDEVRDLIEENENCVLATSDLLNDTVEITNELFGAVSLP